VTINYLSGGTSFLFLQYRAAENRVRRRSSFGFSAAVIKNGCGRKQKICSEREFTYFYFVQINFTARVTKGNLRSNMFMEFSGITRTQINHPIY